jgi:hypothetical protein
MAARLSCVCAWFVDAVLGHVMCMKRKNGFTDGCTWEYVHSDVAQIESWLYGSYTVSDYGKSSCAPMI